MKLNPNLENLETYSVSSGAELSKEEKNNWLKLDWNEATVQPNKNLINDIKQFIDTDNLFCYPDVLAKELKQLIADYNFVEKENIEIFNGSDSALSLLFSIFIFNGAKVLLFEPTYTQVKPFIQINGGEIISSEIADIFGKHQYSLSDIKKADIIYIVNPNNPTGFCFDQDYLKEIISSNKDKLFIVDEAYFEFSGKTIVDEITNFENLIVTRTFSKAFGLAGVRLGYVCANKNIIKLINKVRNSKDINSFAQISAISSLKNINFIKNYCEEVKIARDFFINELTKLNYKVAPSEANFVLVKTSDSNDFINFLKEKKVLVRDRNSLINLKNCVRITIGTLGQMKRVVHIIKGYKNE
jgi:histidinol-phosphate aminotransferase